MPTMCRACFGVDIVCSAPEGFNPYNTDNFYDRFIALYPGG